MLSANAITDVCIIVEDLERSLAFYRDQVGFTLRRHAPGFADFQTRGVTLAIWQRSHLLEHTGIASEAPHGGRTSMTAVELTSAKDVDGMFEELSRRGVIFLKPPRLYSWNAYACYFEDPDHHLWEIYAWAEGGHAGLIPW